MYVALLANTAWLDEELAVFRHLVVGLIDEQVRVVQVVPQGLAEEDSVAFGQRVTWQDTRWSPVRRFRLGRLADSLEQLGIDVIHALDGRLWGGAFALSEKLHCPAVFAANSALDVALARRWSRRIDPSRIVFAPTTEPISQAMRRILGPHVVVEHIAAGVSVSERVAHLPNSRSSDSAASRPLCAVISGNAVYDADYDALFGALASILADHPDTQLFLDSMGAEQHGAWQAAKRYELLSNMSLVPRRLGHRELLLRADVLIHPQALGRSRGVVLQSMATGIPIIARQDPWLDYLIDDQTAWVVTRTTTQAWQDRIRRLFDEPSAAGELGRRARLWVKQNRSVARQIDQIRMLYQRATGEGLKFPGPE